DHTIEHLPGRHRDRIVSVVTRIDEAVSAFFRGRLIIMFIKGVLTAVALWIAGVPFALILGVVTGVGSLIPIAGFLMGLIPGVTIAFLDSGSLGLACVVAGIFVGIEIFENYLLGPWILRDRVGLHPILLIVSVFVGGALFGFVGMLLAVPTAAALKILYLEFVLPEIRLLAAEKPEG
ncbi:MAG: AI-2E family transporter, partial [Planctomycetota bacterium]